MLLAFLGLLLLKLSLSPFTKAEPEPQTAAFQPRTRPALHRTRSSAEKGSQERDIPFPSAMKPMQRNTRLVAAAQLGVPRSGPQRRAGLSTPDQFCCGSRDPLAVCGHQGLPGGLPRLWLGSSRGPGLLVIHLRALGILRGRARAESGGGVPGRRHVSRGKPPLLWVGNAPRGAWCSRGAVGVGRRAERTRHRERV